MILRLALALLVALLLVVGCEDEEPPDRPAPDPPPRVESPGGRAGGTCPNEERVVEEDLREGSLVGDVDGDGTEDEVELAVAESGRASCRAFLVVTSATEGYVLPVGDDAVPFELGLPTLSRLAPIDDLPGQEIVLDLVAGASTQFVGLFGIAAGELRAVEVAGDAPPMDDLFPYGGSAGHVEAVDCVDDDVVASTAVPSGESYAVERRFFEPEAGVLQFVPSRTERETVDLDELGERFPEFPASPFSSC